MDLDPKYVVALQNWAENNDSVLELWLFGSRAKGTATQHSDVDIALCLIPPKGNLDWSKGNYFALGDEWQRQLEAILGRHVSLEAIEPGTQGNDEVRRTGVRLWARI